MQEIPIVYMVAGMSSRFGGEPKWLVEVGPRGESLIEYSISQAIRAGFNKIIFIVGKQTERFFRERFGNFYIYNGEEIPIEYCLQSFEAPRERPWGTVDAIYCAKDKINGQFLVCNGDDIYGENTFKTLIEHIKKGKQTCATIGYELGKVLSDKGPVNRGIFQTIGNQVESIRETLGITRGNMNEKGIDEKTLCSQNIFVLDKKTLNELGEILKNFKEVNANNPKIECLLPSELSSLIQNRKTEMDIYPAIDEGIGVTFKEDVPFVKEKLAGAKLSSPY